MFPTSEHGGDRNISWRKRVWKLFYFEVGQEWAFFDTCDSTDIYRYRQTQMGNLVYQESPKIRRCINNNVWKKYISKEKTLNDHFRYLLVLPQHQMNHIRQISTYKNTSCATIIRAAIQQAIIKFEADEKPALDRILKSHRDNPYQDAFFSAIPWEESF